MDSLTTVFQGLSAVGSAVSGWSQYKGGKAQEGAYKYNAEIAVQKAQHEEELSRAKYEQLKGKQAVLYAKSGVDLSSGSPLLVMADTAFQEEQEAQYIEKGGENEWKIDRYYGKVAAYQGEVGGWSTFLTGLGKAGLGYVKSKAPYGTD